MLEFERKFPTGLAGDPPNLDVVLTLEDGSICAIESKFLRSLRRAPCRGVQAQVLRVAARAVGVACAPRLPKTSPGGSTRARSRTGGSTRSSLLKHLLGVARRGGACELLYLWYRVPGPAGAEHAAEVEDFAAVMRRDGVPFRAVTYQSLVEGVAAQGRPSDQDWVDVHDRAVPAGGGVATGACATVSAVASNGGILSPRVGCSRRRMMVAVIENKRDALGVLCRKYGVVRMYVFGSAVRADFRPGDSDVDLLVEFAPIGGYAKARAYFELLDELQALLGTKVDLVMAGAVRNRYIARDIESTKQLLYAA